MNEVIDVLVSFWLFDVAVFSSPWLYIPFLIPFMFYLMFFFIKWSLLTAPLWLPLKILITAWKGDKNDG